MRMRTGTRVKVVRCHDHTADGYGSQGKVGFLIHPQDLEYLRTVEIVFEDGGPGGIFGCCLAVFDVDIEEDPF